MTESKNNDDINEFLDVQYQNGTYEKDDKTRKKSTTKRIPIKINFV